MYKLKYKFGKQDKLLWIKDDNGAHQIYQSGIMIENNQMNDALPKKMYV